MKKPALRGVPAFVLVTLLSLAPPSLGQDGPLFPGFEPSEQPPAPVTLEDAESPSSNIEEPLPADDSITPLDENGRPMSGPEVARPLRLPAPPPLPAREPVTPHGPESGDLPSSDRSLLINEPLDGDKSADERVEADSPKRNLWQRSTDALRDLTQPKSNKDSAPETDSTRQWQLIRQREIEQQQKLQREQRVLQQKQLEQRQLQQRELVRRQFEQRQLQQRKSSSPQPGWDPRTRVQGAQPQTMQGPAPGPGVDARTTKPVAPPQTSSRRQPQRFNAQQQNPQLNYPAGKPANAPSARARKPTLPREAKNEPRSPWERS